jgi:hypothetical protein
MNTSTSTETDADKSVRERIEEVFGNESYVVETKEAPDLSDSIADVRAEAGQVIGKVRYCSEYDCNVFWATKHIEKHYMQKYDGYAIDDWTINWLIEEYDVERVMFGIYDTREILEFKIEQFTEKPIFNEGYGDQRAVPESEAIQNYAEGFDKLTGKN